MVKDFYKAGSGKYVGYKEGKNFYSPNGEHVGKFKGKDLHLVKSGNCVAEIVGDDYLAKKMSGSCIGVSTSGNKGVRCRGDKAPSGLGDDPEL